MHVVKQESRSDDTAPGVDAGNLALAAKYACQGPRYTSYPTAPQFTDPEAVGRYQTWLKSARGNEISPLSLYVHLPFCQDICYYCACNKVVTREAGTASRYLDRLEKEIELQASLHDSRRPVTQLHWGGGTPTYLDDAEMTRLMHHLARHFRLSDRDDREYAIEIDPRTVSTSTLALLKGLGFNRVSLGIQDFDPLVQQAINRTQSFSEVEALVNGIRQLAFSSMGFDLIYGLPHQDRQSMAETLRKVIALRPDRVACYNYAHLPARFSSQRAIDRLTLPSASEKLALHEVVASTLQDAGYVHIGMDHFVLPTDELARAQNEERLQRNFQGYSLQLAQDLLGLGASAISQVGNFYIQNERKLDDYYAQLDAGKLPLDRGCELSEEDRLRRYVIMSLTCDLRLDFKRCEDRFAVDCNAHFSSELESLHPMVEDGLVTIDPGGITVNDAGRPFLRNLCMKFDTYLQAPPPDGPQTTFSATI